MNTQTKYIQTRKRNSLVLNHDCCYKRGFFFHSSVQSSCGYLVISFSITLSVLLTHFFLKQILEWEIPTTNFVKYKISRELFLVPPCGARREQKSPPNFFVCFLRVSLCVPGRPGGHYINQSASRVKGTFQLLFFVTFLSCNKAETWTESL